MGARKKRMRMKEEFGVDLFELTGDQSGGQEGKSEARERTLGMVQYQTLAWYNTKPWYGTIPNLGMVQYQTLV